MRLIFMGSDSFAVPALEALVAAGHQVAAVCSQPPRRAGRGRKLRPTPLAARASELGLDVRLPERVSDPEFAVEMAGLDADCGILVAYGQLLPGAVLSAPTNGFLNLHPSLLPRWRGAAPVQRAILAGDSVTGACIMKMNERFDDGPVLMRQEVDIPGDANSTSLASTLAATGAEMLVDALARIDRLQPTPQGKHGRTAAPKIDKSETVIDWTRPAAQVSRQIRALAMTPGAWTTHGRVRLRILAAEIAAGSGKAGEVLNSRMTIACGEGAIRILQIQRPGRNLATTDEFLRGYPIAAGELLGGPAEEGR